MIPFNWPSQPPILSFAGTIARRFYNVYRLIFRGRVALESILQHKTHLSTQKSSRLDPLNLVLSLDHLATHRSAKTVLVNITAAQLDLAYAAEIQRQVSRCIENGIQVFGYLSSLNFANWVAVATCTQRFAPPMGGPITFQASLVSLDLQQQLEKLDIGIDILLNDTSSLNYQGIAGKTNRPGSTEVVRKVTDRLTQQYHTMLVELFGPEIRDRTGNFQPISTGLEAASLGLISGTTYPEFLENQLRSNHHYNNPQRLTPLKPGLFPIIRFDYGKLPLSRFSKYTIPVVEISGPLLSSRKYCALLAELHRVRAQKQIKGILLVIDVPGGDLAEADHIAALLRSLRKDMMLVAYVVRATSAGYFVASSCDHIVASPYALVGAIGAISYQIDYSRFWDRSNSSTDKSSWQQEGNEAGRDEMSDILKKRIEIAEELFLQRVALERNISLGTIRSWGHDLIFTGLDAKEYGLVDIVGGIDNALYLFPDSIRKKRNVVRINVPRPFHESMLLWLSEQVRA